MVWRRIQIHQRGFDKKRGWKKYCNKMYQRIRQGNRYGERTLEVEDGDSLAS